MRVTFSSNGLASHFHEFFNPIGEYKKVKQTYQHTLRVCPRDLHFRSRRVQEAPVQLISQQPCKIFLLTSTRIPFLLDKLWVPSFSSALC